MRTAPPQGCPDCPRSDVEIAVNVKPSPAGEGQREALEAQETAVPALALALAVDAADRRRRQAEWLAQRLASYGHSPTRKDGRELECGHAFCRHGCAYCWLDVAEKSAGSVMERRARRAGRGKGQ